MCPIIEYLFAEVLLICGYVDWRKRELPLLLLGTLSICAIILWIWGGGVGVVTRIVGIVIGGLFLGASKVTQEAIGYGDSILIMILGMHLGAIRMLYVLFGASILAGVVALVCLWKFRWSKKVTIPFVPFIAVVYLGVTFL